MIYKHFRHATSLLTYGDFTFLLDPMLAPKEDKPPIQNSSNDNRNPRVDFPIQLDQIEYPNFCLVTHLHLDHFDDYARNLLPKDIGLICQTQDASKFRDMGFNNLYPVETSIVIGSVEIVRVPGQHGTGEIAKLMGTSSGYILKTAHQPTLYLTGDTIYYDAIAQTLDEYKPEIILAFTGGARFKVGDPITLTPEDVQSIRLKAPKATIICTHLEAINHCLTTRGNLKEHLLAHSEGSFIIPADGELIHI
ncbi:MBL fold metallo-hydrolase [Fusibacter ferrireducens]|uniref:MBL fold metallo-hydrolase n=1 Tax=Fusibacter ferrireducens TaxID=2785058 RepID=A0ABR9ZSQ8_9FIRM|nr:MBL fold metallo-hydrolase [Fusibacter ferrireducens]MBF4693502.1 MBL fold metallo-hydrolase [Fusibacter ferrireducens]